MTLPGGALAAPLLSTATAADDQLVRLLVLRACALAERRYSPRRHGVATALRLPLAAAVRMVDGVHRRAAHGRSLALPAAATSLAGADVLVVDVADLPDRRATRNGHTPHLARGKTQHCVRAVLCDELNARAGRARQLRTLAGLELDVVHEGTGRDVLQRERVPHLDVRGRAGLDDGADTQLRGREDIALGAVCVMKQRDARRAVRVVLDRRDLRRHAVLGPLEIDPAETPLVPAAMMAGCHAAARVPATLLRHRLEQALLRGRLRDLLEGRDGHEAPARRRRLVPAYRH